MAYAADGDATGTSAKVKPEKETPHVVIIGGGFGGLAAARAFAGAPVRITLFDSRNHHLFQPLLYQVATGSLSPAEIARPIRTILRRQRNVSVTLREVTAIDASRRRVEFADGHLDYDYLILATGARHAYFGHPEWEAIAPGLKSLEDALEIRRRILLAFERADREEDPEARRAQLTFAIVGAGPTGVELAGAIAEIARHLVSPDFRHIDASEIRVMLVEAAPRVLNAFPESLSAAAEESLRHLGVETVRGTVISLQAGRVVLSAGGADREIRTATILWAAGVAASPLARSLGVPLDRAGRLIVNRDLTVPGYPNVFTIGDIASLSGADGKPLPGVAPVAMQQGQHAALNILRTCRGDALKEFRYHDKGNLATIGRAAAVADFGWFTLSGFPAWLAWLGIHILFLIGFRNRFVAMFTWAWTYFTYDRAAMLIVGPAGKQAP